MMNKHIIKLLTFGLLMGLMISCGDDDDTMPELPEDPEEPELPEEPEQPEEPEPPAITEKTSGYVLHTSSQGETATNFVQFFDEIPTGEVDNTQGKSFPNFFVSQINGNSIISGNVSGTGEGLSQVKFDLDGEAFESAFLPTTGGIGFTGYKDETAAYFDDRNSENIVVFNPTTMEATSVIDMSTVFRGPLWTSVTWETFVVRDNDLFVWSRPGIAGSGSFYATDSAIVNHIDLNTGTYQGTTFFDGHGLSRRSTENWVDEQGNIFMAVTLSNPGSGAKPSVLKIPAGSTEFDPSYEFFFVDAVSDEAASLLAQFTGNFEYYQNGLAYSVVSTSFPPEFLELIDQIGLDPALWTQDDLGLITASLFSAENGEFVEIDVNAQTTRVLDGLPPVSAFGATVNVIGDKVYLSASSSSVNAVYEYDPATGQSTKLFDVTAGGQITGFHRIGE